MRGARLTQLMSHAHQNVAVVALANKLVRIAWAVLFRNETYRSSVPVSV
jgi:transposase